MPIKKDVSSLPGVSDQPGQPPVKSPIIVNKLAEVWYQQYLDGGEDLAPSMVEGARWRASWSGMCARAVGYNIQERDAKVALATAHDQMHVGDDERLDELAQRVAMLAPTNPPSIADAWRFGLGTMVHEALQKVIADAFPGATIEMKVKIDDFGSASVDIVIDQWNDGIARAVNVSGIKNAKPDFRTSVELKTINGFGYKMSATTFNGPEEGPRSSAVMQGAMAAVKLKADRLIVGYLSLECLSPDVARRNGMDEIGRFAAEWHYTPEEFTPIAEKETKRVRRILQVVDARELAPRAIPDLPTGARIVNPGNGVWEVRAEDGSITDSGKTFHCAYCNQRDRCLADGA